MSDETPPDDAAANPTAPGHAQKSVRELLIHLLPAPWNRARSCGECGIYLFQALGRQQRKAASATSIGLYQHFRLSRGYYEACTFKFVGCGTKAPAGYSLFENTIGCEQHDPAKSNIPDVTMTLLESCIGPWADDPIAIEKAGMERNR